MRSRSKQELTSAVTLAVITVSMDNLDDLEATLKSASFQNARNFRHIVIDSSRNEKEARELAAAFNAEFHWVSPAGIYPAMAIGLSRLRNTEYCWFLNSGDSFASENAITAVNQALVSSLPQLPTWVVGQVKLAGPTGVRVYGPSSDHEASVEAIRKGRIWFPHPSTIVSVSALKAIEPFDNTFEIAQDYLISLKLLERFGPPLIVNEVLSTFRLGGLSTQKTVKTGLEAVGARIMVFGWSQIYREIWNVVRVVIGRPLNRAMEKLITRNR
jgi:hypothetical protein